MRAEVRYQVSSKPLLKVTPNQNIEKILLTFYKIKFEIYRGRLWRLKITPSVGNVSSRPT